MSRVTRTRSLLAGLCALLTAFGGLALAAPIVTTLARGVDLALLARSPNPAFALEVAWSSIGVFRGLARPWVLFMVALSFAYLLPLGGRVVASDPSAATLGTRSCLRRAISRLPTLAMLFGLVTFFKAVILVLVSLLVGYSLTPTGIDETQNLQAFFGVVAVAAFVHGVVRVVHDVARVSVLHEGAGPLSSLGSALVILFRRRPRLFGSALWRMVIELSLTIAPVLVVMALPTSSVSRIVASAILGQAAILASLAVRLSFFDVIREQTVAPPRQDALSPRLDSRPGSSVGRAED